MYLILQQDQPDDYVIATGITTTIRDFIKMAGAEAGLEIIFKGDDADEKGYIGSVDEAVFCEKVGEQYLASIKEKIASNAEIVEVDPQYFRLTEVGLLIGDPTKSKTVLGWEPEYDLKGLVEDMMQSDLN
nr:GDP-mannose 4,6-dehydratase [uncultured Carboxylicivirga sp.]